MSGEEEKTRVKKIAIVGCSDTKDQAPFNDASWEIWGVNNLFHHIPRYDRWFEIHNLTKDSDGAWKRRGSSNFRGQDINAYVADLAKMKCPIYMQQHWDDIPTSTPYPLEEAKNRFGSIMGWYNNGTPEGLDEAKLNRQLYGTNTVTYMILLAIMEGATHIGVYGVDMAVDCLAPETRILTADLRWIPCADVKVGDEIIGFDENSTDGDGSTRRWRKTTVKQAATVMNHCYRILFEDGTSIIASENHGWLTHGENINRWKTTKELFTNHHREGKPTRILKVVQPWEEEKSWNIGYLSAAFECEGFIGQSERKGKFTGSHGFHVAFSQKENVMYSKVIELLDAYGFAYSIQEAKGCKTVEIRGGKAENMRFLGIVRPQRLLDKFCAEKLGELQSIKDLAVVGIEDLGIRETIGIETTTKTIIAEGLASHNTEYHYQRPSCEFALGIAFGLGIKIYIPPQADLLKTVHLYGFEERLNDEWHEKLKKMDESMANRQNKASGEMETARSIIDRSDGAHRIIAFIRDTISKTPTIEDITTALNNAENDVKIQTSQAKAEFDKGYSAQQQYIGARQASKEIIKIWGTIR
jgi:hypothetical protein